MSLRVHPAEIVRESESPLLGLHPSWGRVALRDVATVQNGFAFPSAKFNNERKGTPLIRIRNVGSGGTDTWFDGDYDPAFLVHPGDLLVGMDGDFRAARWTGPPALLNQRVCRITPSPDLYDATLLLRVLPGYLDAIHQRTSAVTVKHLSSVTVQDLPIPLPPLAEQQRIVDAIEERFTRLDAAEVCLRRAIANIDRLRGSTVDALFNYTDWPWTTLGEIAEIRGGVTKDAKLQSDPAYEEVPYLRVANVQRGWLDLGDVARIRVSREKADALRLEPGDVLFNEGGDRDKLGRGWVWEGQVPGCIHQNHVFRARLGTDFEPKFVSIHGNRFGRKWFEDNGRQTTNLASINMRTLKNFPVPAPPRAIQTQVVDEIERRTAAITRLATDCEQALRRSAQLRRSILAQAFSGQLVPQAAESGPLTGLGETRATPHPLPHRAVS